MPSCPAISARRLSGRPAPGHPLRSLSARHFRCRRRIARKRANPGRCGSDDRPGLASTGALRLTERPRQASARSTGDRITCRCHAKSTPLSCLLQVYDNTLCFLYWREARTLNVVFYYWLSDNYMPFHLLGVLHALWCGALSIHLAMTRNIRASDTMHVGNIIRFFVDDQPPDDGTWPPTCWCSRRAPSLCTNA